VDIHDTQYVAFKLLMESVTKRLHFGVLSTRLLFTYREPKEDTDKKRGRRTDEENGRPVHARVIDLCI